MEHDESERQVPEEHLARHIGFAERWLARAKQEVTDGQLARSVLTLLLAEAEVHHARERTLPAREVALPRPSIAMTILGATALMVLLLAGRSLFSPRGEMITGFTSAPAVVKFKQPGSTLALVPAVLTPEQTVAAPAPRVPAPLPRVDRVWRNATRPSRPAAKPRPISPAVTAPAAPVLVSDGDLIDLVIAAEQSLRGEKR